MKKSALIIILFFIINNSFSQLKFEQGYFIDNAGKKTVCLIKNSDWRYNPDQFSYKLSENTEVLTAYIPEISEFGINDIVKFKKFTVEVDQSSDSPKHLSENRNPDFVESTIFLKYVFDGSKSLLYYENNKLKRYFIEVDSGKIEQLIYKRYVTETMKIKMNDAYKQQLLNYLKCDDITIEEIKKTEYNQKSISKLFLKFNKSKKENNFHYYNKGNKSFYSVKLKSGLDLNSVGIEDRYYRYEYLFDRKINFTFGVEVEYYLPFNNNKWAFTFDPSFKYYNSSFTYIENLEIKLKYIDLPIGLKYFMYFNDDFNLYLSVTHNEAFKLNSKIVVDNEDVPTFRIDDNKTFGLGINFKNRYSLEFKYGLNRKVPYKRARLISDLKPISLIFGYRILSTKN